MLGKNEKKSLKPEPDTLEEGEKMAGKKKKKAATKKKRCKCCD